MPLTPFTKGGWENKDLVTLRDLTELYIAMIVVKKDQKVSQNSISNINKNT